eukprot:IDg11406t1
MVPPLLLDARAGEAILDLCAAPGSKTGQMIEALCAGTSTSLARPGLVVANDADIKRCWMLAHQLKRFGASQLVVTHHDAQFFPKVRLFDRVLCDVPCSGDGTLRKAPDIWRRWNSGMGMGLHRMQCTILFRGVELLRPGGRLVYSTCSLNPIENEAIVAAALQKFGPDIIQLVDVSDQLPQLKRRPGMTHWKVPNLSGESIPRADTNGKAENEPVLIANAAAPTTTDTKEAAPNTTTSTCGADQVRANAGDKTDEQVKADVATKLRARRRRKVVPTMFPPSKEQLESGLYPLERCLRLVPMDQDTGGFFVAVFHKKATAPTGMKKRQQNFIDGEQEQAAVTVDKVDVKADAKHAGANTGGAENQDAGNQCVDKTQDGAAGDAALEVDAIQKIATESAPLAK